jgi:hypothetical protein
VQASVLRRLFALWGSCYPVGMTVHVANSRLERVVVFGNGALITRRVDVPAGADRIAIVGLPLRLTDDSLRVRPVVGAGAGAVQVGLVEERCQVQVTLGKALVDEAALLEARLAIMAIGQRRQSLHTLRALDGVTVELPPTDIPSPLTLEPLLQALSLSTTRATSLAALEATLDDEERRQQRILRDLERQGVVDDAPPRVLRGLEASVVAPDGGQLELEYFVAAARWVPSYALHLRRTDGGSTARVQARLILGALVAQATGEDWHDVDLSVSTSTLNRACTLPVVHSWRLGRAQPARLKGYRPLPSDLPQLFSGWDKFPHLPPMTTAPHAPPKGSPRPRDEAAAKPVNMPPPPPPAPMPTPVMLSASMAPPGAAPMPQRSAAPMASRARADMSREMVRSSKSRLQDSVDEDSDDGMSMSFGAMGGGGFPESDAAPPEPEAVVDELPPRLRTTGMRMVYADAGAERGQLMPMNLRERLAWLLDTADVDDDTGHVRRAEVHRALDALEAAESRLRQRPLPPGTQDVGGARARTFTSAGRATIASDGHEHRVEVHREEGPAEIVHQAVAREALDVWRVCRFSPTGALPSGPVQVYEDDAFVVAGRVDGSAGATMSFNLGIDPDVRIESRTPHITQAEKGLMSGTSTVTHQVVTMVRSTRPTPVRLTIFDRLPRADDDAKDVVVALVGSTPPLQQTDRGPDGFLLRGGVAVTVTLMPGDAMRLEHTYTLTLPAKLEVVGGNRRE